MIHVIPAILPQISKQFAQFLAKEGFETGLKDVLKAVALQLVKNCGEELAENLARGLAGAVSPWQLLQIPVEILIYLICKLAGSNETFGYGLSKLASLVTAGAVGVVVRGPVGLGTAVLFWVLGEIAAWIIRKLVDFVSSGKYSEKFGESQTEALLKTIWVNVKKLAVSIGNWLNTLLISGCSWIKGLLSSPSAERTIRQFEGYNVTI